MRQRIAIIAQMILHLCSFQMMYLNEFQGDVNQKKDVLGRFGGSSVGFLFGSSLPLAAGRRLASSSVKISNSSSSLP